MKLNASTIKSFENRSSRSSGNCSIQILIASIPRLCGILEYNDSTLKVAKSVSLGIPFGKLFKKSVVSLRKLGTCLIKDFNNISNKLLILCIYILDKWCLMLTILLKMV